MKALPESELARRRVSRRGDDGSPSEAEITCVPGGTAGGGSG